MNPIAVAAIVAATVALSACADTVIEVDANTPVLTEVDADGSIETVPSTTLPIVGSTAELLAEMATDMSALSGQIAADGDERATLARIEAIWAVAEADVEAFRRDLAGNIQTTVDMARTAVTRIRPADADKAFSILTGLVDRYTGDS